MAGNLFSSKFTPRNVVNVSGNFSDLRISGAISTVWTTDPAKYMTFSKSQYTGINTLTNDTWTEALLVDSTVNQALEFSLSLSVGIGEATENAQLHARVYVDDVLVAQGNVGRSASAELDASTTGTLSISHPDVVFMCKKLKVDVKRVGTFAGGGAYPQNTYISGSVYVYQTGEM